MLWNSTGSLGSCAAAAQGRAGGTRPAVTPLCRAWRPPGWDSQGRARAVPPGPQPHLGRLALRDGILHHVIRWHVPFLRYGVKRINHAILPALFCSFYYRSAVVQRRVVRQKTLRASRPIVHEVSMSYPFVGYMYQVPVKLEI